LIAFCEECGTRVQLTPDKVAQSPGYVLCPSCGEVIKIAAPKPLSHNLEVQLGETVVRVDPARPILTMGRKRSNDLVLQDRTVSRTHSTIVYLDDAFSLFDLSRNGTSIRFDTGEEILLRKSGIQLHGSGLIGLGKAIPSRREDAIRFQSIHDRSVID
jgi:hypothetical protein